MNDLQIHHKLLNKIEKLEKQVIKHRNAANSANATKDKNIQKGIRTIQAKLLLELNQSGDLNWSVHEIAACCNLGVGTIRGYQSEMRRQ